jgi:Holliday junction resolvase RusA-like endonuclease
MELIKALLVYHLEGREVKPLIWSLKANKFKLTQNDCVLEYTLYCKAKGRSDLDNTFKAIQDALNGIAYEDDKQIVKIIAQKYRNCGYDGFDLKVYEYKGD